MGINLTTDQTLIWNGSTYLSLEPNGSISSAIDSYTNGSFTFINGATGTTTGSVFTNTGYNLITVVSSTPYSATISFQGSYDGTTWYTINGYAVATTPATTLAAAARTRFNISQYLFLRANITAYTSGTITIKGYYTTAPGIATNPDANYVAITDGAGNSPLVILSGSHSDNVSASNMLNTSAMNYMYSGTVSGAGYERMRSTNGMIDGATNGIQAAALSVFNGANYDRMRGATNGDGFSIVGFGSNQLLVSSASNSLILNRLVDSNTGDAATGQNYLATGLHVFDNNTGKWQRIRTGSTDAQAGTGILGTANLGFNGTSWDRFRSMSGITTDTAAGLGVVASGIMGFDGASYGRIRTANVGDAYSGIGLLGQAGFGYIGSGLYDRARISTTYKTREFLSLTNGSATDVWYSAGKKWRLMQLSVSGSTAGKYALRDGASTIILYFTLTANTTAVFPLGNGLLSSAAGQTLWVVNSTGSTANVWCNAWGVEE